MRKRTIFLPLLVFFLFLSPSLRAAPSDVTYIRDAEIESYIRHLSEPVFKAAEVEGSSVRIILIQNGELNAFVAGGMNIFLYTGLLQTTDTPEQLLGVIAHETGHIAGGHLIRGREAMENASTEAIVGMLFGVAAGMASGNGKITAATLSGAQQIAERNLLSFSRTQESSADSAALSFLDKAGVNAEGLHQFMKKLEGQEMLPAERQAEYVRTHPIAHNRLELMEEHLKKSRFTATKLDPSFEKGHERMKAKLLGFLQPEAALLRYTDKDKRVFARYARAIALYRTHKLDRALPLIQTLLAEEPDNPFFHELKGQMLFENGRVAEAIPVYRTAVELLPSSPLLRVGYAHALLEGSKDKDKEALDLAIRHLLEANRMEGKQPDVWRHLAAAWGRKAQMTGKPEDEALVSYALAEESLCRGADQAAKEYATRALKNLTKNSPYALRAQDIKLSVKTKPER